MSAAGRRYDVVHRTTYAYDEVVTDSYGLLRLRPRDLPGQTCHAHEVGTDPAHADLGTHRDGDHNELTYLHVTQPHRRLTIEARSAVSTHPVARDPAADELAWEDARPDFRGDAPDVWAAMEHTGDSPLVDVGLAVFEYAAGSFPRGRPLVEAVLDLTHRIHTDLDYRPGATTVSTRVADVLARRRGVCQDFAHLAVACLRSQGLAARYVSGYLATDPPPGRERMVGADATHAWAQCWLPGYDWLAVDPTNDCEAAERHLTLAWGRDYADVPPVSGVIFTDATHSTMQVTVDVAPAVP